MKKIFALFVVIHGLFSSFAQTSDKSLQISAPAGYRVYINTEFKGVTSDSQDGLLVKKIQPIIFLEVKKQNNIVYSDSVIIENEILEINLYKEIIEEKPKTAYDYWQEYFDILNNERSVKNYMERNVSFLMPNKPLDATRFLADLRSYNMTESIEFNGLPIMKDNAGISNLFYYGHLTDIKSFSGTKAGQNPIFLYYTS